ncbi:multidrug effflux MFS transporter [Formicincola oecophyllae]|uniref:Bcr/CflA family efflux transporter n=2 Tax=Formicincola oecophyllae TaxID=2558361 RepID=A0A4Y6UD07_9PROT|nr:multidrug effflux MFS transporter [Formicincola oecophyllae]
MAREENIQRLDAIRDAATWAATSAPDALGAAPDPADILRDLDEAGAPLGPEEGSRPWPVWFPLLLGTLTAVGPISTDIYLPALPEMESELGAAAGSGSLTMTAWVVGIAAGQLVAGPLADRFGRRLPLVLGTLGYAGASAGCALATSMPLLCSWRAVAALMAAASLVVPNAVVRDMSSGNAAARFMSRLVMVQGVVPILAPALGGLALNWVSWRSIFWAMAAYGVVGALLVLAFLPETLAPESRAQNALQEGGLLRRYSAILRDPTFRWDGLVWMIEGWVTFAYLTTAPSLFERVFHLSPFAYGSMFGLYACCIIGNSQLNGWLVGKVESPVLLKWSLRASLLGALVLLGVAVASWLDAGPSGQLKGYWLWPLIVALLLTMMPMGGVMPNAAAGALGGQGKRAGTASALAGTGQYVMGMVASALCALMPIGTALPMAALLLAPMVAMTVCAACSPRRRAA